PSSTDAGVLPLYVSGVSSPKPTVSVSGSTVCLSGVEPNLPVGVHFPNVGVAPCAAPSAVPATTKTATTQKATLILRIEDLLGGFGEPSTCDVVSSATRALQRALTAAASQHWRCGREEVGVGRTDQHLRP